MSSKGFPIPKSVFSLQRDKNILYYADSHSPGSAGTESTQKSAVIQKIICFQLYDIKSMKLCCLTLQSTCVWHMLHKQCNCKLLSSYQTHNDLLWLWEALRNVNLAMTEFIFPHFDGDWSNEMQAFQPVEKTEHKAMFSCKDVSFKSFRIMHVLTKVCTSKQEKLYFIMFKIWQFPYDHSTHIFSAIRYHSGQSLLLTTGVTQQVTHFS